MQTLFGAGLFCHADYVFADLFYWQNLIDDQALRDDRLEFVEDDVDGIDFGVDVAVHDAVGESMDLRVFDLSQNADVLADDFDRSDAVFWISCWRGAIWHIQCVLQKLFQLCRLDGGGGIAAAQEVAAFAAYALNVDVLSGFGFEEACGCFVNVGVESSGQALVAGYNDDQNILFFALD